MHGNGSLKNKLHFSAKIAVFISMAVFSFFLLFPYLWMVSTSLKRDTDVFTIPMKWIPDPVQWDNYKKVWTKIPFLLYYFNTIKVTVLSTLLQILVCSLAAYAFARLRFRFKNVIFMVFLSTMMIPWHIMIPQFMIVSKAWLYDVPCRADTHAGLQCFWHFSAKTVFHGAYPWK